MRTLDRKGLMMLVDFFAAIIDALWITSCAFTDAL